MATTRIGTHINAPRATVYRLLLEADAVKQWMMPDGMSCEVHRFEPEAGGSFSITVTSDEPPERGIPELQHDAYYGRFLTLVPDEQVVEVMEFVTGRPDMEGAQSITFSLSEAVDGGTDLEVLHEDVPKGLTAADNETHWRMGLRKLAALAERGTVD